jgi:uncharacterized membrane protein
MAARDGERAMDIEAEFRLIAGMVALCIEAGVVLIVAGGALEAMVRTGQLIFGGKMSNERRRDIWLRFAVWILLALEFALAADIIRTAIAPTWDDVGKLGAIAAIRTVLNWFLGKDIEAYDSPKLLKRRKPEPPAAPAPDAFDKPIA